MKGYFEATSLPFNRNAYDESKMIHETVQINKSSVEELCAKEGLKSYLFFLSAAVIVLTKYTNNQDIFIRTNILSNEVPLTVDDGVRNDSVYN